MYNPRIGKWLSADPIGFDGKDVNLYRYAGNAPTHAADPMGLRVLKDFSEAMEGTVFMDQYYWIEADLERSIFRGDSSKKAVDAIKRIVLAAGADNVFVHYVTVFTPMGKHGEHTEEEVLRGEESPMLESIRDAGLRSLQNIELHAKNNEPLVMYYNMIFAHTFISGENEKIEEAIEVLRYESMRFGVHEPPVQFGIFGCGAPGIVDMIGAANTLDFMVEVDEENMTTPSQIAEGLRHGVQGFVNCLDETKKATKYEVHMYFGEMQEHRSETYTGIYALPSNYHEIYGVAPYIKSLKGSRAVNP